MSDSPPITQVVLQAIRDNFRGEAVAQVEVLLAQYGTGRHHREVDRVRWGIATVSNGDVANVERLVKLADRDYRDAIMETEYALVEGKLMRVRTFPAG